MAPVVIPTRHEELEEMLQDGSRMRGLFNADGTPMPEFGEFITAYARATAAPNSDIAQQIRDETRRVIAEFMREEPERNRVRRVNLDPESRPAPVNAALFNPNAMGAALDDEFEGSADYFRTIWHGTDRTEASVGRRINTLRNAFSSTVPSEGGFLIPETLRSELLRVALETAVVRPRARVIPMESLRVPFPAIDATSNVSSIYGGIIAYWTEEGAALTASNPSFSRVVLDAKKLTAYAGVPNELIADSAISFGAFIDQILPEAIAWYEDLAFLTGNGVGQPLGVLNASNPALVSVAAESGQGAATILWQNIVKAYSRMLPGSLNRAVWIVAPDTFPELATMALSVGTGGSAIWLNNGSGGPPMTILGRPVIVSEKASTLGAAGDVNFVDFSYYLVGDRQVMSAMSSPHYLFGNDMTAFRVIERVDGTPWLRSAITPQNNSTSTLSPYVNLAAR